MRERELDKDDRQTRGQRRERKGIWGYEDGASSFRDELKTVAAASKRYRNPSEMNSVT